MWNAKVLIAVFTLAMLMLGIDVHKASAAGCGGYVNILVWGCAPWDNNPMCPYHPTNCRYSQPAPPVYRPTPAPAPIPPMRAGCAVPRPGDTAHYICQLQKQCDQKYCLAGCEQYRYTNVGYYNTCSGNCARVYFAAMQTCPR